LQVRRFRRWLPIAASLLLVLLIAGVGIWWFKPAGLITAKPSVAVLPFDNLGDDDATGRLANGITEDVITDLATFPEFDVVARNSTKIYGSKPADPRQISRDLGVGYVLEGSIQRQAGQIRITAQLIDGQTGNHLWSERWDRHDTDIFAVQTEIADQVANKLGGGAGIIQTAGREAARRKRPDNLTAYELYLLGTEKLEQIRAADNEEAIKLLTRAVELDPEFARAWVELYHAHAMSMEFGVDKETAKRRALDAAERAVALDPRDAEAHAVLAMGLGDYGQFARTKAEFDTALSISPGSAEILTFYAGWASSLGEPERGAEVVDRIIRLDPNYPMWQNGPFSYAYFMAGRYEDVVRLLERVPTSNYTSARWIFRASSYAALGRADDARASVKQALDSYPNLSIEGFINDPGWSEAERQRMIETMRAAGFPPCAKPGQLAEVPKPVRLPECTKE
jgi:TolB-like protein/Tfp pilus assembly protein PilF